MEMNVTSAQNMLSNPSTEIQKVLDGASDEAKAALGEAKASLNGNDGSTKSGARGGENGETLRVQVVDEEKKFSKELSPAIERWGLLDKGFGYDVVSVFGSQSTGKSTLLNRLFGTSFDVMNEKARKQTTKGIWMCKAKDAPIMVMDVEGTDGRERGEDQDFERKSALFSLAASEVLIINLWEHQVGLYQGANMGLLKTVFEVNLGLFGASRGGGKEKTMLMFVIRDHVGATPLSNLEATLTQDMERIWASLSKPEALQTALLTDYFDLAFTPLPHKLLLPDQFATSCLALAARFTDRSSPDYVFQPSYHKRIPADGVAHYMESIWDQVQSNSDLDIPTQQELLAQFRCDEIAGVAIELVREGVKGVRRIVESGKVVEGLGEDMEGWRTRALAHFDKDASRYHSGVYHKKRLELLAITSSELSPLFLGQVKNLHKACVSEFKAELQATISGGKDYDFAQVVSEAREKWEAWFVSKSKDVLLKDVDWQSEDEYELVKEEFTQIADQLREFETKKMVKVIERNVKKQLSEPIEFILTQPKPDMWDRVLEEFSSTLEKGEAAYLARAKTFATSSEQNSISLASLRLRSWLSLVLILRSQTSESVLLSRLRSAFEERFRYGEGGVPRVWKEEDDIDAAFVKGKEETLRILPIYARISPANSSLLPTNIPSSDPSLLSLSSDNSTSDSTLPPDLDEDAFSFPSSLTLLSPARLADLEAKFRREADALFVEAKRSVVSQRAMIPVWVYGALVVLGWNEFLAVVTNPLYFTSLLVLAVGAFLTQRFGMSGPLLQVVGTVWAEVHRQVVAKMREAFAPEEQHRVSGNGARQRVPAPSSRGGLTSTREEEIEMKEK